MCGTFRRRLRRRATRCGVSRTPDVAPGLQHCRPALRSLKCPPLQRVGVGKDTTMFRHMWVIAALLLLPSGGARADDKPNPDQLQKAYNDALVQLQNAQNAKNELAGAND